MLRLKPIPQASDYFHSLCSSLPLTHLVLFQAPHIFAACSHLKAVTLVVLSPTGKKSPTSGINTEAQPGPLGYSKTVAPPHAPLRYGPGIPGTLRMPAHSRIPGKEWTCTGRSTWAQACQQGALPQGWPGALPCGPGRCQEGSTGGETLWQ